MERREMIDAVWTALDDVIDPELGLPITDLGLVYDVDVMGTTVIVEMTTTTPICPLGDYLTRVAEERVAALDGVEIARVTLTNNPPWTPARMSNRARAQLGHS